MATSSVRDGPVSAAVLICPVRQRKWVCHDDYSALARSFFGPGQPEIEMPTYSFTHGDVAPRQTTTGYVPNELTHQDATNLRVRSVAAHQITRVGPVLRPGTVYAVKYHDMFTWTRQSRTPAAYGPTADCTDATRMQDWHYTCQAALPKTQKMAGGTNYLFVVGPINHAPSCMLLFFFNSCDTLDSPYRACAPTGADGAVAQGIYLPAIYDRDTGTLFSETFEAPLNAADNINELKWHIYGKAQSIGNGDCCTRLTMTRAKVTARLCQPAQAAAAGAAAGWHPAQLPPEGRPLCAVGGGVPLPAGGGPVPDARALHGRVACPAGCRQRGPPLPQRRIVRVRHLRHVRGAHAVHRRHVQRPGGHHQLPGL